MQHWNEGPPTAAPIGDTATLLQRFGALGPAHRAELIEHAYALLQRERRARLTPAERRIDLLIDTVDRLLAALDAKDIASRHPVYVATVRAVYDDAIEELASLGITYFGEVGHA